MEHTPEGPRRETRVVRDTQNPTLVRGTRNSCPHFICTLRDFTSDSVKTTPRTLITRRELSTIAMPFSANSYDFPQL